MTNWQNSLNFRVIKILFICFFCSLFFPTTILAQETKSQKKSAPKSEQEKAVSVSEDNENQVVEESQITSLSVFTRALKGGYISLTVLIILTFFSVFTWAVIIAKWIFLKQLDEVSSAFIKIFWESRSLNELNNKLQKFPYSPAREIFKHGYAELVRGSQLRDHSIGGDVVLSVVVDNLTRVLQKTRFFEKKRLEKNLGFLAIAASSSPFIGLFGTVWGIMAAFEGIARRGSASLAAVAPGISEALIATAFGLAAAIPAVIFYNLLNSKIRYHLLQLEGFSSDFLNIVERYIVSDRGKTHPTSPETPSPSGASPQANL